MNELPGLIRKRILPNCLGSYSLSNNLFTCKNSNDINNVVAEVHQ